MKLQSTHCYLDKLKLIVIRNLDLAELLFWCYCIYKIKYDSPLYIGSLRRVLMRRN